MLGRRIATVLWTRGIRRPRRDAHRGPPGKTAREEHVMNTVFVVRALADHLPFEATAL